MKYTEHLVNSFLKSPHTGSIIGANIINKIVNKETGDAVKIYLVAEDGNILNAKFQACGSVVLFASLSAIMDLIVGKSIQDANEISEKQVINEIKQVNRCDYAMVAFAVRALKVTLANYYKKLSKNNGEEVKSKKIKVKTLTPSNTISIHQERKDNQLENVIPNVLEIKNKKPSKIEIEEIEAETSVISKLENEEILESEEDVNSASISKHEIIEAVPTKIEVRVMEEDPEDVEMDSIQQTDINNSELDNTINISATVQSVKKEISKDLEEDNLSEKKEDVIDEIDSITAKLTDAITKLNFKFDVDDNGDE